MITGAAAAAAAVLRRNLRRLTLPSVVFFVREAFGMGVLQDSVWLFRVSLRQVPPCSPRNFLEGHFNGGGECFVRAVPQFGKDWHGLLAAALAE